MKVLTRLIAALVVFGFSFSPALAQNKPSYSGAWVQTMSDSLEAIYSLQEDADDRLKKVEKSYNDQNAALSGNPNCRRIDCKSLTALLEDFGKADAAVRASQLLGYIAVGQQTRLAENTNQAASAIRKGVRVGERTLFWQEFALGTGELALHIVAAMATGDVTTLPEALIGSMSNMLISKGTGYPDKIGDWTEKGVGALGGGELTQTFAGTLSAQLTRFGGVSVAGGKMIFQPKIVLQNIGGKRSAAKLKEIRRLKAIRSLPNVVDATLQAVFRTVTAPSVNRTRADLARNRKELRDTVAAWREYLIVTTYQKLYNREYGYLRGELRKLRERADALRQHCAEQVRTRACGDALETALTNAEKTRVLATAGADAKRKAVAEQLNAGRKTWSSLMAQVGARHQDLRAARDGLAETEFLNKNRDRIRDLAFNAASAETRAKYRKDWDDLQGRKPLAEQRAMVKRLEKERADLWQAISAQRTQVASISKNALAVYAETNDAVNKAETAYFNAVADARSALIKCLGQSEASTGKTNPTLAALRKQTGSGTLAPSEILGPANAAFEQLNKTLAETRIRIEAVDGAQCNPVASRLDGCWYDVSRASSDDDRSDPVHITTKGGSVTAHYTKQNKRYTGTYLDGTLKLTYRLSGPAELSEPFWWSNQTPPPAGVVRETWPQYQQARKELKITGDSNDRLTGIHHGAYVTWSKTTKKMTGFEAREYKARWVRGDKPKLRSIAFVDSTGNRLSSQSLSDSFRISAKGVAGCPAIIDAVRVKAYLDDDKETFVWATLRETGKDTLQFEGVITQIPALTSSRAGGSVKQLVVFDPVGLRGAAIRITGR